MWIKKHRKAHELPDVSPYVDTFGKEWQAWWAHLLPAEHADQEARKTADYSDLKKAGPNGLFLLMLSLVWWGAAASDQGEERIQLWRSSLGEFTTTVKLFNESLKDHPERKRALDSPENVSASKRCVYVFIWSYSAGTDIDNGN